MDLQNLLLQQFQNVSLSKNWFVSLDDALLGLTEEQAEAKISGEEHSIKELVIHITYWMKWYYDRYHSVAATPADQSNEYTFTDASLGYDNIRWEELKVMLDNVLKSWQEELKILSEEQLLLLIPGSNITWFEQVADLIQHIIYHTGQIVCLRKISKNWNPGQGVE